MQPYVEEPHNFGLQVSDYEKLFNMTLAADHYGLQVAYFHNECFYVL